VARRTPPRYTPLSESECARIERIVVVVDPAGRAVVERDEGYRDPGAEPPGDWEHTIEVVVRKPPHAAAARSTT
jgi:hypothetical protein